MVKEQDKSFGLDEEDRIRLQTLYENALADRGLKKESFANDVGLSVSNIRKAINKGETSRTSLREILDGLNISADDPLRIKYISSDYFDNETRKSVLENRYAQFALVSAATSVLTLVAVVIVFQFFIKATLMPTTDKNGSLISKPEDFFLSPQIIEGMFSSGDIEKITSASEFGLSMKQIEAALKKTAPDFFKSTINNPEADTWFKNILLRGLNPEMYVDDAYYGSVSILFSAMRSANANAMIALMDAGASPHPYVRIEGAKEIHPYMLHPAHKIAASDQFSIEDKKKLLAKIFDNSLTFYQWPEIEGVALGIQTSNGMKRIIDTDYKQLERLTDKKPDMPSFNLSFKRPKERCIAASKLTGKNWCEISNEVPAIINVFDERIGDVNIVYVQDLINVSDNTGYFYVAHFGGYHSRIGVLEVTPDRDRYNLFLYGNKSSSRSKTHCNDGNHRSWCWLKYPIRRTSDKKALLQEYYNTKLVPLSEEQKH